MLERDGYLPGVPWWVDTTLPDPEAAVAVYNGLFGWDFTDAMPPGSAGRYFSSCSAGVHPKERAGSPAPIPRRTMPARCTSPAARSCCLDLSDLSALMRGRQRYPKPQGSPQGPVAARRLG
jgi:hypothetical protein